MKKLLLIATLLVGCTLNSSAQKLRFGATADLNVSTITSSGANSKAGAALGVKGKYLFTPHVFMDFGLKWSMKGWKSDLLGINVTGTAHYLEIPVNVGYRYAFNRDMSIYGAVGPYFGFGVGGKESSDVYSDDYFGDKKKGYAQAFDFGFGFGIGFQYKAVDLHLGYELGVIDIYEFASKNRNFYVGLGYWF